MKTLRKYFITICFSIDFKMVSKFNKVQQSEHFYKLYFYILSCPITRKTVKRDKRLSKGLNYHVYYCRNHFGSILCRILQRQNLMLCVFLTKFSLYGVKLRYMGYFESLLLPKEEKLIYYFHLGTGLGV